MSPAERAPIFFDSPAAFRAWLAEHHETAEEVWVGFHKRATGRPSLTWPESVDEALCYGWIDGVRRSLGPEAYTIRFTRRKPSSTWSAVNIARVEELIREGRMTEAGGRAFDRRREERSRIYAYEQAMAELEPEQERHLRADPAAWAFWEAQPPSYRRVATWWIISARRPETRARRLATLVEDSAAGRRIRAATHERRADGATG